MASWKEIRERIGRNDSKREREAEKASRVQPATRDDIRKLTKELRKDREGGGGGGSAGKFVGKAGRMIKRGMDDVGKSMNTPYAPGKRPRISQMPRRSDSDMLRTPDIEKMKMGGMRGRDIRGRRVK